MRWKFLRISILISLIAIIGISIIISSSQNTLLMYSRAQQSGTTEGKVTFKGSAFNKVKWEFLATLPVDLLIIKEVTLEYLQNLEIEYGIIMDMDEYYVSRGKFFDSGETPVETTETIIIQFETEGEIQYSVILDPFIFDFKYVLYTILGILLLLGLIEVILLTRKSEPKEVIFQREKLTPKEVQIKSKEPFIERIIERKPKYCAFCGNKVDSDANFCHECGHPLNLFKYSNHSPNIY